jgi:hypothetical protein
VRGIIQHASENVCACHLEGDVGLLILRQAIIGPDPRIKAARHLELLDNVSSSDKASSLLGPLDPKREHGDFDSGELGDDCRHAGELPRHDILEPSRLVPELECAMDEVLCFEGRCIHENARECAVVRKFRVLVVFENVTHRRVRACKFGHDMGDVDVLRRLVPASDANHHHRSDVDEGNLTLGVSDVNMGGVGHHDLCSIRDVCKGVEHCLVLRVDHLFNVLHIAWGRRVWWVTWCMQG